MKGANRGKLLVALLIGVFSVAGHLAASQAAMRSQARGGKMACTQRAYPTGDKDTSIILLERFTPVEVRVGQAISYTIKVTNLTSAAIDDVVVAEQFPKSFKVDSISPEPGSSEPGRATWTWAELGPRATKETRVSGTAEGAEEPDFCATVTFKTVACAATRIVEPELVLTKSAPAEVLLCDPIPLRMVVSNPGTGVARNVRVSEKLPQGWATADVRTALAFDIGDLAAGQAREVSVSVRASKTGELTNTASATEEGGLSAEASARTVVRQPMLAVSKTGPEYRYVGRPATFEITVANQGDAPARETVLVDSLPDGVQFISATEGGRFSAGKVTWNLGTIAPSAAQTVQLAVKAPQRGTFRNSAVAKAYCAEGSASAALEVRGIPAILLEVIDIHDPIEVGQNETYEIAVVNQGSADGTNIVITCMLPEEQEYVSGTGPTRAEVRDKKITFAPLASLAPKAKATYRVVVKGVAAADVRFKVSLTSDQIRSPVEETESTQIY
jgi:uncharacterized repeat protein (TIGR01451 family)